MQDFLSYGYECGYFTPGANDLIDEAIKVLLKRIRPQAIPLIEIYNFPDEYLQSAIGNSYGDIYETHFRWAKESRLNYPNGNIPPGWKEKILPIMNGKM